MLQGIDQMAQWTLQSFSEAIPRVLSVPGGPALLSPMAAERLYANPKYRCGELDPGHEIVSVAYEFELVPQELYAELDAALSLREAGATVLFRSVQTYVPAVQTVCQLLANATGIPMHANAYWTPPGCQGFPLHADQDSIFVVQCAGTKVWTLFRPRATSVDDEHLAWIYTGKDDGA